jgi:hypothetical protein
VNSVKDIPFPLMNSRFRTCEEPLNCLWISNHIVEVFATHNVFDEILTVGRALPNMLLRGSPPNIFSRSILEAVSDILD